MKELFDALGGMARQAQGKVQQAAGQASSGEGFGVGSLLGSAALGGVLGAMLGGKGIRKAAESVGKGALMAGGAAVAAGLAWKMYQKWGGGQGAAAPQPQPQQASAGPEQPALAALDPQEELALTLMQAMVFAARSDGFMDDKEKGNIRAMLQGLPNHTALEAQMERFMNMPLDPQSLAARVSNAEEGRDLYRLSCLVVDIDHFMERGYLDALGQALGLSREQCAALEQEAQGMKGAA